MNGNTNHSCTWTLKFSLSSIVLIKIKKKILLKFLCVDFYGCRGSSSEDVPADAHRSLRWKLHLSPVSDGCHHHLCFVFQVSSNMGRMTLRFLPPSEITQNRLEILNSF